MDEIKQTNKKSAFHYAWVILLAMCVIRSLSAAGINNTGGLFLSPVSSDLGVGIGNLSIYFSVSSIATLCFMPIAGKLVQKYSIKLLIIIAAVLQTGGFMLLGLMNSVWGWYILSIPMGIGGAVLVNLAGPILINRWFKNNTGTALGILMASVGIFGAVIQPLVLKMIAAVGWRGTYVLMGGVVCAIILVFSALFIKNSPSEKGVEPLQTQRKKSGQEASVKAVESVHLKTAIKSPAFYFLLVFMIAITAFGAFSQHMASYGQSIGYTSAQMGKLLSISMIGSTVGALFIGFISDKIGVFKTAMIIIGGVVTSIICLSLGGNSYNVFAVGSFLLGLSSMGIPVLAPLLTSAFFGEKDYEAIYSNVMMGPPFASVVLMPLYGFLFDLKGNYSWVLLIMGLFALVGGICICAGWNAKKKLHEQV